jgi:hypothetical protein
MYRTISQFIKKTNVSKRASFAVKFKSNFIRNVNMIDKSNEKILNFYNSKSFATVEQSIQIAEKKIVFKILKF